MASDATIASYASMLRKLLPPGPMFKNLGPNLSNLLISHAAELGNVDDQVAVLIIEMNPGTSTAALMLPVWENCLLLPDEYPNSGDSESTRQARLVAKLRLQYSGPSPHFFIAQAAALGVVITIEEGFNIWLQCGDECGKCLLQEESVYIWKVNNDGSSGCKKMKALILRLKPSHTAVTFDPPIGEDDFMQGEIDAAAFNYETGDSESEWFTDSESE